MASPKRFTDTGKWRTPSFRALSMEAKLTWIYICDECDHAGVWKSDYDLATFQLGFSINEEKLSEWFKDKIVFIDDLVIIIPFFKFQYGTTKDTWAAKQSARKTLESFGFSIIQNNLIINQGGLSSTVHDSGGTVLSKGIGIGKGIGGGVGETMTEEERAERLALIMEFNSKKKMSLG